MKISSGKLCNGDWNRRLKFEVFDHDNDGGHDFIGEFYTTLEEMSAGEGFQILQWDVINPEMKRGSKHHRKDYVNSGTVILKSISVQQVKMKTICPAVNKALIDEFLLSPDRIRHSWITSGVDFGSILWWPWTSPWAMWTRLNRILCTSVTEIDRRTRTQWPLRLWGTFFKIMTTVRNLDKKRL